jgi:hypothetical protein
MAQCDEITAEEACEHEYRSVSMVTTNKQTNTNEYDYTITLFFVILSNIFPSS